MFSIFLKFGAKVLFSCMKGLNLEVLENKPLEKLGCMIQ